MKTTILFSFVLLNCISRMCGQGSFVNLDFEATLLATNARAVVSSSAAFPGWTVYRAGVPQSVVGQSSQIGGAQSQVSLYANSLVSLPLSGNYCATLQSDFRDPTEVSLAQTGLVPPGMRSLTFKAANYFPASYTLDGLQVSLNNVTLSLQPVGFFPGYTLFGADISAFAGTMSELRFTALPLSGGWNTAIDDIMFSASPVPEPSTWALLLLGGVAFACFRWRHRS